MTRSAIWQTAETFGAIPSHSLTSKVTHCVAANLGTEKTYRASKLGVPVVWQGWFWESVNLWKKQDERIWLAIPDKSNGNTPGASTPTTPALPTIPLVNAGDDGIGNGEKREEEGGEGEETFEGDEGLGDGWDDEAQAELDAFLDGSSDFGSDAGRYVHKSLNRSWLMSSERTDLSREGTPGTPSKKRVRYADEEQLPLETFKDPSPNRSVYPQSGDIKLIWAEYHPHRKRGRSRCCWKHLVGTTMSRKRTNSYTRLRDLIVPQRVTIPSLDQGQWPTKTRMRRTILKRWCVVPITRSRVLTTSYAPRWTKSEILSR